MKGIAFNECLLMDIFPTGFPHGQGGRGVTQMQTAVDRGWGKGGGGQKLLKMCGHPLWMAPYHKMLMELKNFKKIIII